MKQELTRIVPMIRRFAYSLTGSYADADDLLQSTVEKILSKPVPEDAELSQWAFRICRNLWIDEFRARKIRQHDQIEETEVDSTDLAPEQTHQSSANVKQIHAAMDVLPADQRSIISLVAIQGMSYKEVASTLSVPVGTVMSRLARARASLSQYLKHQLGEASYE
ncbi:RNA polymerase subunit sigma-70 [Saccharobesus litoralis]|uniref:RNA polymerase subunit sigma-70 n=1 Tax=Saccharobesus litoralis TaxID=2172099 RepID=A0A2S0VVN4_9ALTE|nr:RNA polymerase sigma factor [Saccharobesus litoralis]AWB68268.1 RNA polymerase subunit sigma-70 [Saccharobesus litoralis]